MNNQSKEPIRLQDYLVWLKNEIRNSEDEITPVRAEYKDIPPDEKEARELYFRTTEVEVEFEFGVKRTHEGKIFAYVLSLGKQKETTGKQKIKIRLVSQGHKFSANIPKTSHAK